MMGLHITFEQCKWFLKCYWKPEDVKDIQTPTCLTISRLCDKFEADARVQDMHKKQSGGSCKSADGESAQKCYRLSHNPVESL